MSRRGKLLIIYLIGMMLSWGIAASSLAAADKVTFWAWWTVSDEDLQEMSEAIGYEVDYRQLGFGDLRDQLVVSVAAGTPPDLIYVDPSWFDDFASQDALMDLNPLIERFPDLIPLDDIFPVGITMWSVGDKQLALPNNLSPELFWYNNTLFVEAGLPKLGDDFDVNQWFEFAKKLTVDRDDDGVYDQYGYQPWWYQICNLIWSYDGHIFKDGKVDCNNKGLREALQFYKQFWDYGIVCDWQQLAHMGQDDPQVAWQNGLIVFAPGGIWVPGAWTKSEGEYNFDVQVAHQPLSPIGKRAALVRGNGLAIPNGAPNVDGAFRLVSYLLGDKVQTDMAIDGTNMPSRISIATSDDFLPQENIPYDRQTIIESLEYHRGPVKGVNWSLSYDHWNSPIKQAFSAYYTSQITMAEMFDRIEREAPPVVEGR